MKKNLTAIIVTFMRDEYFEVCLKSLRETYPDINILVGDNNGQSDNKEKLCKQHNAKYVPLEFDSGICVARNELVKLVETDYIMIGDDDFKYNHSARVDDMLKFLEHNKKFDLIGGRIIEGGAIRNYQGFIAQFDDHLEYTKLELENFNYCEKSKLDYKQCDLTFNFFVARTKSVKTTLWDEKIKVAYEHSSFFIDFINNGNTVAFTPNALVEHKPKISVKDRAPYTEYAYFRNRKNDKKRFFERFKIDYAIDMAGRRDFFDGSRTAEITFLVTHFERKDALKKLLISIAKHYPHAKILIADNSRKFIASEYKKLWDDYYEAGGQLKPTAYNLKYDCGLSFLRNFLMSKVQTQYALMLEDDFVFNEKTKVEKFADYLEENPEYGIVGGMVKENGCEVHFEHNFDIQGNVLRHVEAFNWSVDKNKDIKFSVDCVLNFMMLKKEVREDVQWDDEIKIKGEHTDYFLRLKETKWKVGYLPEVEIDHNKKDNDRKYNDLRKRDEFLILMMKKHGLTKIIHTDGHIRELKNNKIIKHSGAQ